MSTEVRFLAIVSECPLQWVLYVVAIAMSVYAAILGSKERRSKLAILTLAVLSGLWRRVRAPPFPLRLHTP
ncbi:hypothetical protein D4R75_00755 [bacterium]|nr:MAG: hypothetical protein D4R75_00755 [bacterium]